MLKAKKSMVLDASVAKVFSCLEVFLRYGEWDGEAYLEVKQGSPGPVSVGFTVNKRGARTWVENHHQRGPWPFVGTITTTTHHQEEIEKEVRVTQFVRNECLEVERKGLRATDGYRTSKFGVGESFSYYMHPTAYGGTLITLSGGPRLSLPQRILSLILLPFSLVFWAVIRMSSLRTVNAQMRRLKWAVESPSSYPFPLKCPICGDIMPMFATDWKPPQEIQMSEQVCPECGP